MKWSSSKTSAQTKQIICEQYKAPLFEYDIVESWLVENIETNNGKITDNFIEGAAYVLDLSPRFVRAVAASSSHF